MTNDQIIELSKQLIAIQSTNDNPEGLQQANDLIVKILQDSGKDITIEQFNSGGKPSLLAYRGKQRPDNFRVILNGHLDVVHGKPSQYNAVVKDGKLYGRGSHDEKPACIVLTDVFCQLVDKVPYTLGLQMVTDEEVGGENGAYYQIQQGVRADFVICAECGRATNVYEIANETKGIIFVEVKFSGKTAHGGYPWRGDNAAIKASKFAQAVHDLFPTPPDESHDTTVTVTALVSETGVHNRIPEYATVKLDIRFAVHDKQFQNEESTKKVFKDIDPSAEVNIVTFASPMYSDPNGIFVQQLKKAAEAVEGHPFKLVTRHAGNDGRHFIEVGGQACEFGIAGEDQHGDNEHVPLVAIDNYRKTIHKYLSELE